jgi:hypothetical protein
MHKQKNKFEIYEGYWKNNKAHGKGKFIHIDGDIYDGDWVNDKANCKIYLLQWSMSFWPKSNVTCIKDELLQRLGGRLEFPASLLLCGLVLLSFFFCH